MDNDDILIRSFMDGQRQEVSDNGFTRRVMERLPQADRRHTYKVLHTVQALLYVIIAVVTLLLCGDTLYGLAVGALADAFSALISDNINIGAVLGVLAVCSSLVYYRIYELATKN